MSMFTTSDDASLLFTAQAADVYSLTLCLLTWSIRLLFDKEGGSKDAKLIFTLILSRYFNNFTGGGFATFVIFYLCTQASRLLIGYVLNSIVQICRETTTIGKQDPASLKNPLKPLIFPSRTTHTRMFPKIHSFSYSYLLVGIPIGWQGLSGSMVSADIDSQRQAGCCADTKRQRGWFSVEAADYLHRGSVHLGLQGKLHDYLRSQGECPGKYPFAYLVTAPRFLGYSFNPVSFWYLYSKEKHLTAMILEVNNTFDERRMYFLEQGDNHIKVPLENDELPDKMEESEKPRTHRDGSAKFASTWAKDFHVSPFNSRKGSYALAAYDPFSPCFDGVGTINNTITLSSSKSHAKLVARIFSIGPPADPSTLTFAAKFRFILTWWWVGFVTFPRIVKEAGRLFFRRKLHVWYRPEVLRDSIGRKETERERFDLLHFIAFDWPLTIYRIIESCFRRFLRSQVEGSDLAVPLKYVTPCVDCQTEELFYPMSFSAIATKGTQNSGPSHSTIDFKVLSPLFYSRIVRFAHMAEFLSAELLQYDEKDRTIWVSDPKSVLQIFHVNEQQVKSNTESTRQLSWLDSIRWTVLRCLRRPPLSPKSRDPALAQSDIRRFPLSPLDQFVRHRCEAPQAPKYRQAVTALLASDYVALGVPEIFDVVDRIVRMGLCYFFVTTAADWLQAFRSDSFHLVYLSILERCNLVHLWWFLKSLF